jgi:putative flavoprotein involved in K+ transport
VLHETEGNRIQRRRITAEPGLYILGLDWLHQRNSGLFNGMSEDAVYLASVLADQQIAVMPH